MPILICSLSLIVKELAQKHSQSRARQVATRPYDSSCFFAEVKAILQREVKPRAASRSDLLVGWEHRTS